MTKLCVVDCDTMYRVHESCFPSDIFIFQYSIERLGNSCILRRLDKIIFPSDIFIFQYSIERLGNSCNFT
jgi:hypothetical protein